VNQTATMDQAGMRIAHSLQDYQDGDAQAHLSHAPARVPSDP